MRQVGDIKGRKEAARFASFLAGQKIQAELRDWEDDVFRIWVLDEDLLARAEELFAEYQANPQAAKFDTGINRQFFEGAPEPADNPIDMPWMSRENRELRASRERNDQPDRFRIMPVQAKPSVSVTITMIGICVLLYILVSLPQGAGLRELLLFSTKQFGLPFSEIREGQVWRLITPIFLHGSILHLVFNMLWLLQLGSAVESNERSRFLVLFVLATGSLCNTAQYLISGPFFIGMSGVVYGLLGYVYMMSRYQAGTRYALHPQTMGIMMIWLVICLIGLIPNVANTQHVAGLAIGSLWGFLRSGHLKTLRRRRRFKN